MMRRIAMALTMTLAARAARAEPARVDVVVVELAGELAFVEPGGAAGLRAGDTVTFGDRALPVVEVTAKTAAVRLDATGLQPGAKGVAMASGDTPLPPVAPPDAYRAQWPAATPPASAQHPEQVALGRASTRRTKLLVESTVMGTSGGGNGTSGELDGHVATSFAVAHDAGIDADITGRLFTDGWNAAARTPVLVNAATLRLGDPFDPMLAVGRIPYAATSVGMLDGARAVVKTGDLELAAFGGIVPDPVDGHPDLRATRFGLEGIFDDADAAWQPRAAVAIHGSTWDGELDERRLSLAASAHHAATWLDGWLEVDQFAANNPWDAPSVQITGAGATAEWRGDDGVRAGIDAEFLRPERSLRLDDALPPTWACTRAAQPGNGPESCLDTEWSAAATASAGEHRDAWSIDAVGTLGDSHGQADFVDYSGYLRGELRLGMPRVFAAVSGGDAGFLTWQAVEAGVAMTLAGVDFDVAYRPERLDYEATTGGELEQGIVGDVHVAVTRTVDVIIEALGTFGSDGDVLAILSTIAWRPLR
jgi:hypothetical protein